MGNFQTITPLGGLDSLPVAKKALPLKPFKPQDSFGLKLDSLTEDTLTLQNGLDTKLPSSATKDMPRTKGLTQNNGTTAQKTASWISNPYVQGSLVLAGCLATGYLGVKLRNKVKMDFSRVLKQNKISFSDESQMLKKVFGKGFDEKNLEKYINDKKFLGCGSNANVYDINKNYVLRVPRKGYEVGAVKLIDHPLNPQNFGQAVGTIGNAQILFKQKGLPAGVPYGPIRKAAGEEANKLYMEHLVRASKFPQSSYDDFAAQLSFINSKKYVFDPSKANNLLLDSFSRKFNLVDLNYSAEYRNSLADMVVPLIDNAYCNYFPKSDEAIKLRKIIIEKAINAAKKEGLPMNFDNPSLKYSFDLAAMPHIS